MNSSAEKHLFRRLIDEVLLTDSDLSAFFIDKYPAIHKRFTSGMDRVDRINRLLECVKPAEALQCLRDTYPAQVAEQEPKLLAVVASAYTSDVPVYRFRRVTTWLRRTALALPLVAVPALFFWRLYAFSIPAFSSHQSGVILFTPWIAWPETRQMGKDLCDALQATGPMPVRCINVMPRVSPLRMQQAATKAGAVIVATFDEDRVLTLHALSERSKRRLPIQALPKFPVASIAEAQDTAHAVKLLRAYVADEDDGCDSLTGIDGREPHIALIGMLLHSVCENGRPLEGDGSSPQYTRQIEHLSDKLCNARDLSDPSCALAKYLQALNCPEKKSKACSTDLDTLRELARVATDNVLALVAGIELSRRLCEEKPRESFQILRETLVRAPATDPCWQALMVSPGYCAYLNIPAGGLEKQQIEVVLRQIQQSLSECPSAQADILEEVGTLQLRHRNWAAAARSFDSAFQQSRSARSALNLAEALLLMGQPTEVTKLIIVERTEEALRPHASFLLWLADPSQENAKRLLMEYGRLPVGKTGAFDAGRSLRDLCCTSLSSTSCLTLKVLLDPKDSTSEQMLRNLIKVNS